MIYSPVDPILQLHYHAEIPVHTVSLWRLSRFVYWWSHTWDLKGLRHSASSTDWEQVLISWILVTCYKDFRIFKYKHNVFQEGASCIRAGVYFGSQLSTKRGSWQLWLVSMSTHLGMQSEVSQVLIFFQDEAFKAFKAFKACSQCIPQCIPLIHVLTLKTACRSGFFWN